MRASKSRPRFKQAMDLMWLQALARGVSSGLSAHVRFIAFFGTPITNFQGVRWSKFGEKLGINGNSDSLRKIGQTFATYLKKRADESEKIWFHSFYEAAGLGGGPVSCPIA